MDDTTNALRTLVRQERLGRRWSQRRAATEGHISNTTWSQFEDGSIAMSSKIIAGVAIAFDWPPNWATVPPRDDLMQIAVLRRRVLELVAEVKDLTEVVAVLVADRQQP
jgi:transcriptional regulator with XRE-family HTH domain